MSKNVKYKVTVKTGDDKFSGTDNNVYIIITGSDGKTDKQKLNHFLRNDHKVGGIYEYSFECKDVGTIEYITLSKKYFLISDDWYVDFVKVTKDGEDKMHTFPIYKWMTQYTCSNFTVTTNETRLPQKETEERKACRSKWINNCNLQWDKTNRFPKGLPGFVLVCPEHKAEFMDRNFSFPEGKMSDFKNRRTFSRLNAFYEVIVGKLNPIDTFDEYHSVTHFLGDYNFEDYGSYEPRTGDWISKWKTDEEFGRQVLNGPNPIEIRQVKELPENFPVTDDVLQGLLHRGLTLQEEIEAGNIYIINHQILSGISSGKYQGEQLSLPAPMCLLYLLPNDQLVPIAIQLGQDPGPKFPIWTPNDKEEDWLLAKMWFKNGDIQVSQFRTHLFLGHLINEAFVVALHRNLSPCHPIFKLMREHFEFVLTNNVLARAGLIIPGGAADKSLTTGQGSNGMMELILKSFEGFHYNDMDFPESIKVRGVGDLPNYHFRDDALLLWIALSDYVADMMDLFYMSDRDVQEDWELQNFVDDLAVNGFKFETGIPKSLDTKEDMYILLTRFLFATAVGHTYANFLLFEYYRFPPNMPATMLGPLPGEEERGKTDENKIMASLPTRELSAFQIGITWVLSQYGEEEVWLGQYPRWLFTEDQPLEVANKFRKKLEEIEDIIQKRNASIEFPYTILMPSKIPTGVAI